MCEQKSINIDVSITDITNFYINVELYGIK